MVSRRRLIWKVAPWYVLVIGLCTAGAAWYADNSVRALHEAHAAQPLQSEADLILPQFGPLLAAGDRAEIARLCLDLGQAAGVRITVIDPAGVVLGDSDENPAQMENHATRPEIVDAYTGRPGTSKRFSRTLGVDMEYVALPIQREGKVIGVVRTAVALADLRRALWTAYIGILTAGLVAAGAATLLTLLILSRRITRPLQDLEDGARRFAAGDLAHTLPVPDSREIGGLAEALNQMAGQLDEKIRTVTAQASEQQAVLSGMIEGVIALDAQERVLSMNSAAMRLLGLGPGPVAGRKLFEVVRNAGLQRLVERTLAAGQLAAFNWKPFAALFLWTAQSAE